jgi:hypothetical protein
MTVRIYPAPQTPGWVYIPKPVEDCDPCGNRERVTVRAPGSSVVWVIDCPHCTQRGADDLRSLLPRDTGRQT